MDTLELVKNELAQALVTPSTQDDLYEMEQCRITPSSKVKPHRFLFSIQNTPCFPRGELVAVTGKAKSGKTFFSSCFITLCGRDETLLEMTRMEKEHLNVLWIDTEQSECSTHQILTNRIMLMMEDASQFVDNHINIFNLRKERWDRRLALAECAIQQFGPDLVIIDGIRDMVNNINDEPAAQQLMEQLMKIASDLNVCIVCMLHQNKAADDKNMRGWLGSELTNKAFEVYACEKNPDHTFTIRQQLTRMYDIPHPINFQVDANGIPVPAEAYAPAAEQYVNTIKWPIKPEFLLPDTKQLNVRAVFQAVIKPDEMVTAPELRERVRRVANVQSNTFYTDSLNNAVSQRIVICGKNTEGKNVYMLAPAQKPMPQMPALFSDEPPEHSPF